MGENKTSYMFPSLNQDVVNAVSDLITAPQFHMDDSDSAANNKYSTHVMGTFKCNNKTCSHHGWGSKKVAILIRGYSKGRYNAVVFNQRCKSCKTLGNLKLDGQSYVDRVAYRLKKWAGIAMEQQYVARKKGLQHESTLCEGCNRGICPKANDSAYC
ncbi:zf-3CxxC domain-containing protein [Pyrenophora tritici-repentis]|nr:zf-3CxxC domain-containing protein [Pyrenophora tritici-repentis]